MKNENSIRSQIILRIIEPLRKEKVAGIKLRAGDIQNNLELPNQIPAICSALDSQEFLQEARVSLMKREGPTRGANAVWTFRMLYQEKEIEPTDTPNAIKDENPPTTRLAETIRSWVISNIIIPARAKGVENVHLHASDVQKGLGLTNRIPAICSALDSQEFSRKAQVVLEKRDGPLQGTTVEWTFRLVPLNKDDQQPVLGTVITSPQKTIEPNSKINWLLVAVIPAVGIVITLFATIIIPAFQNIWKTSQAPKFAFTFGGAFDPNKPEYEITYPLTWDGEQVSNVSIAIEPEYYGNRIRGPVFVYLQPGDKNRTAILKHEWLSIQLAIEHPLSFPLSFNELIDYSGLNSHTEKAPDIDTNQNHVPFQGSFDVLIKNGKEILAKETIRVVAAPWYHTVYISDSEIYLGEPVRVYIDVHNMGSASDFAVFAHLHEIVTGAQSTDLKTLMADSEGWYPGKSWPAAGGADEKRIDIALSQNQSKIVTFDFPSTLMTKGKGVYTIETYVFKKLPIVTFPGGANWITHPDGWKARDYRLYNTFIAIEARP